MVRLRAMKAPGSPSHASHLRRCLAASAVGISVHPGRIWAPSDDLVAPLVVCQLVRVSNCRTQISPLLEHGETLVPVKFKLERGTVSILRDYQLRHLFFSVSALGAMNQKHNVGILLDCTAFPKVTQHRAGVAFFLGLPVQL